ncbi:Violaxanthin de-epoxidase [Haematococcus lacustris]|uniref:Violaxanthin de-epoxidase n=1 Tax=Haematococcus lacustris TaxID=44745 RepID=A0A699ZUD9_HAELA|nr:Violaxanthin de-epoxidase [Haematococcus lacustris]
MMCVTASGDVIALPGRRVLDNGVTSNEYWRILDCDEDFGWALFYYSGAASAAGLSYSGAVLGTRNGAMPTGADALRRLEAALELAGIKMWELSTVDNNNLEGAPLGRDMMVASAVN